MKIFTTTGPDLCFTKCLTLLYIEQLVHMDVRDILVLGAFQYGPGLFVWTLMSGSLCLF